MKLAVDLCGVPLRNPVIAASGTFGYGREFDQIYDISILGGIAVKNLWLNKRNGNTPVRIAETASGMLNSVGLQNPGVQHFLDHDLSWLRAKNVPIIVNIAGSTVEDYCRLTEILSDSDIDIIEMNISCPNVKEGGVSFGTSERTVEEITSAVKKYSRKPLMVKLTPNVTDIAAIAQAAENGGADAVSLINTITGMAIDVRSRRPVLSNIVGGLSGPAVKPVALRMVWQVAQRVHIPVVGMGGIMTGEDAVEFLLAGASAVMVGTANLVNPTACPDVINGIEEYMKETGVEDVNSLVGALQL